MIDLVARDHLLPVDAQVLALARVRHRLRAARDDQAPGDQRAGVAGPAGLHRQAAEVDVRALDILLLAGRRRRTVAGFMSHRRLGHLVTAGRLSFRPFGVPALETGRAIRPMSRSSLTSFAPCQWRPV
jgi:hypothetical protein